MGVGKVVLWGFTCGGMLLPLFYAEGTGFSQDSSGEGRLSLFGANENALGAGLAIGSMIILVEVIINSKIKFRFYKILGLVPYLAMITVALLTGSRGAFLLLLAGHLIVILFKKSKSKAILKNLIFNSMGVIALSYGVYFLLISHVDLAERLSETIESVHTSGRDLIW
ncbi:MAG: hypothetical protein ACI9DJ_000973 [Algoriphagus sp.]